MATNNVPDNNASSRNMFCGTESHCLIAVILIRDGLSFSRSIGFANFTRTMCE